MAELEQLGVGIFEQLNDRVRTARKRQLKDHAKHAVVVILDLGIEALATVEHQRLDPLHHRRALVLDVSGGRMFEASLLTPRAKDVAQSVKTDFFTDVEL